MPSLPIRQPVHGETLRACALLLGFVSGCFSSVSNAETVGINCAAELDAAVALASNPDNEPGELSARFASLESACPDFAQIAHNQGVLEARQDHWQQAIAHFERALQKDERAADTHRHLQQIFEHRAAGAYAKALGTSIDVPAPTLQLQDSGKHNSDRLQQYPEHPQLRNVATIEYELYAWWQSQQNLQGIREHYVSDYDMEAIEQARQQHLQRQWSTLKREIAFTTNDSVVVLSDSVGAYAMLLMRLEGNRWKIYQETSL